MEYFKFLPHEITLDILTRLPTESVLECKLVRKDWRDLVSHYSFSKMHLSHLNHHDSGKLGFITITRGRKMCYFEYNENHGSTNPIQRIRNINWPCKFWCDSTIGSCDGLMCVIRKRGQSFSIFNPVTEEFVVLPQIKTAIPPEITRYGIDVSFYKVGGFGYVSSTNEYKVVGIYVSKTKFVEVHVYTLGSNNGWRNLGNFNSEFSAFQNQAGIFANGALYWIDRRQEMILTFDLAEEKFREHLSPPPLPKKGDWLDNTIGVLNGFLFLATSADNERDGFHDIWLLNKMNDNYEKKEGEEHQSLGWSKWVRIHRSILLAITKSDGALTYNYHHLHIYDTKTSSSKILVEVMNELIQVCPHKNTLVSLKELGEEDTMTMESVEINETGSHWKLHKDAYFEYIY